MMSPEAVLVEVSEERPHLAGAPVIPETDLEEHELVQATATTQARLGTTGTTAVNDRITLHELSKSCAQAGPYPIWADESYDSQHGNVCFKPGGFKGGGVWACPMGCTKTHSVPWCSDDNDNNQGWTRSAGQRCSANWAVDNAPPYVTGESLDACKTECLAASGCYGIAFTNDGTGQCVTCTGADETLIVGDGAWDYYGATGPALIPYSVMTASQSSTIVSGTAEKALTAFPERSWPGTCTHTAPEAHAWWMVSLSGTWDVTSVQLTNRNGYLERLQGIDVFVGNTKCASDISVGDETKTIPCVGTGNSIKLQHTGTQLLTLCGFAAMGSQGNRRSAPCRVPEILDPARCSSVVPGQGLESGSMSCQPRQNICILESGSMFAWPTTAYAFQQAAEVCKSAWKGVVECPDGISSKGVYFPYALAGWTARGISPENVCAKWDSGQILNNQLSCDESLMASGGVYACTKATAGHVHHASPASGIMIMKRIRCTTSADSHDDCATFKVGICLDVGSDVFNHKHNGAITDMKTQTKAWLAKALPIVDGTATECPPNFRYPGGGLCYKHDSDRNNGAQCGQSSAVKWCALSQTDFEDKTNEFGNCGSFCFACGPNDEMLTNRRIAAY